MKKILIVIGLLLHWHIFTDCTQIFLEDVGLYTAYCPPPTSYNSKTVEVYLIRNNTEIERYVCTDVTASCEGNRGHFAVFNTSGSYFPLDGTGISDMRLISGIKCLFKEKDYNYNESILVVAKPLNVSCNAPALSIDNKYISITCRTSKVYPQAVCTFDMQNTIAGTLTYSHVKYSEVVEYYITNCTWTSPLNNFAVGQYQYSASFFPSGTNNNMIYGTSLTQSMKIILPTLGLSNECFHGPNFVNGYIKPGTTITCICYTENNGIPPPSVRWLNSDGQDLGSALNLTATSLTISSVSDTKTFLCVLSTNLKEGNTSLNYTSNYAKGPSACNLEIKDSTQNIWNICNNEKRSNVSLVCSVNKSDVKPGIRSIISINSESSELLYSEVNNISDNMYRTKYDAMLTQAGNYAISCQVQNSIFNDFKAMCTYSKELQVYAPPESSPILQITNKNKANAEGSLQETEVYIVECAVLGGVPPVINVTVSCGNIYGATQSGNIFTSPVTFTRNMTGQNCTCTAQHITGCYTRNLVQKHLNILYVPAVKQFYTDRATVVDNGTWTMFVCEADGKPLPEISILKDNLILYQNAEVQTVFINKSMSCKDAGVYVCQAKNNLINLLDLYRKNVTIYVKCSLQFNTSEDFTEFSYKTGQIFVQTFTIFGYPEPSRFSVIKNGNSSNSVFVKYTSKETPYGTVDIKILKLFDFDFGNYTLKIFQNESAYLVYNFAIVKENEDVQENVNIGAAVGGSIAAVVLVALFVVIAVYLIRKKPNIFKRNKEAKRQYNPTYSELSVSQSLHDRHTYETPIINANIPSPDKKEEINTSYCNVTANDVKSDHYSASKSPYCNTKEVNRDLFKENNIVPKDNENEETLYVEVE